MGALPLEPQIEASQSRISKSREALTKDFDPDQPRDPHSGRWIDVGSLGVGDAFTVPDRREGVLEGASSGVVKAQLGDGSRTVVKIDGRDMEDVLFGATPVQVKYENGWDRGGDTLAQKRKREDARQKLARMSRSKLRAEADKVSAAGGYSWRPPLGSSWDEAMWAKQVMLELDERGIYDHPLAKPAPNPGTGA